MPVEHSVINKANTHLYNHLYIVYSFLNVFASLLFVLSWWSWRYWASGSKRGGRPRVAPLSWWTSPTIL